MAKRESTFTNMVATLFVVTFVAAAALGVVYDITKDAIEVSKKNTQSEAIKKVLPKFDELSESYFVKIEGTADSLEFFPARQGNDIVGVAIKTFTNRGFGGNISIMVGIDNKTGNISGYEVLEHGETPGLGSKMSQWFCNSDKPKQNVIGKNPESYNFQVSKDGGDIDAITASTITSRAFLHAVNKAFKAYKEDDNQQLKEKSSSL